MKMVPNYWYVDVDGTLIEAFLDYNSKFSLIVEKFKTL